MQATTISKEQRFVAKDMSRAIRKLNEALGSEAILCLLYTSDAADE